MAIFRTKMLLAAIAVTLLTTAPLQGATAADNAQFCLKKTPAVEHLLCLADMAKKAGDPEPCHRADHEGVRWQCVAILAEHEADAGLCRSIPSSDKEYKELRDVCLSDVAASKQAEDLCAEISTPGLRDGCYLKLVRSGASSKLCGRLQDKGLRSACTGQPVYVD